MNSKPKIKNSKLVAALLDWFAANARDLPWRRTRDPYAIWVSEIMLQQTQVKTVIPFWNRWLRELPTIEAAAKAPSEKIHKLWEGLGYYTRVRNLQKAAQQIVAQQSSLRRRGDESQIKNKSETPHVVSYKFPENFDDILALPGIGRYTAGAICSIAFNQPTPILDGNVIRVLTRIFGITENPKEKTTNARLWQLAEELVCRAKSAKDAKDKSTSPPSRPSRDTDSCSHLNQSLMELGALVCTPRNPQCPICPVKKLCVAFKENRVDELPNLGKREAATARTFFAFIIERNGKFFVQQRPAGIVNAYLWEFPNVEVAPNQSSSGRESAHFTLQNIQSRLTSAATNQWLDTEMIRLAKPLRTIKHSITRYRMTLEAFHVRLKKSPKKLAGVWLSPKEFDSLAFSSAHKKLASFAANCILSGR